MNPDDGGRGGRRLLWTAIGIALLPESEQEAATEEAVERVMADMEEPDVDLCSVLGLEDEG